MSRVRDCGQSMIWEQVAQAIASAGNCNTGTNYDASFSIRSDAYGRELTWSIKNSGGGTEDLAAHTDDCQSFSPHRNCAYSWWRVHTRVE